MNDKKICAFTGHRLSKFEFGYDEEDARCNTLKYHLTAQMVHLIEDGVTTFYSGMAMGTDLWCAEMVIALKTTFPYIKLVAILPCETQANKWSVEWRERYFDTLSKCDDTIYISRQYTSNCTLKRNDHLVDNADALLAVYDGRNTGGTAYTVKRATEKGIDIIVINPLDFEVKHLI